MTRQKRIKAICTDIDGTLLNADRWLSDRTIHAFAKAHVPKILASSRMPRAMRYLQEGLSIQNAPLIAYNGGLILGENGAQLQSTTFSTAVLKALIPHHREHSYNLSIYSYDHWFTQQKDEWTAREINNTRTAPTFQSDTESLAFLENKKLGIHKLMCMGTPEAIESILHFLEHDFKDIVHFYRSKDTYIEITPKAIDKAKALEFLLPQSYDFGMEDVIAFGDNHNDDALLKAAGLGVAVGNATPNLKALADVTVDVTNKENAVAIAIERYLL